MNVIITINILQFYEIFEVVSLQIGVFWH